MNCFQHPPESCGALRNPRVEHRMKNALLHKYALTGFTTRAYLFKRLALMSLPPYILFLSGLMRIARHARALNPPVLAFVSFGVVSVQVRVESHQAAMTLHGVVW